MIKYYIDNCKHVSLFALIIKAGSLHEQKDKRGVSHLLEHMHAFVAQNISYDSVLEPVNYAYTNFNETVYIFIKRETECDNDFIIKCQNTIGAIFDKKFLTKDFFLKIKNDVLEEYKNTDFSKAICINRLFCNESYPIPIGELHCIKNLKYDDVILHHDKYYTANNAAFVIISNASEDFVIHSLYKKPDFDFLPFIKYISEKKNKKEDNSIWFLSKYKRSLDSVEQYVTDMLCLRLASDLLVETIHDYFGVFASGQIEILSKQWHIFKLCINFNNPIGLSVSCYSQKQVLANYRSPKLRFSRVSENRYKSLEQIIKNFTPASKLFDNIKAIFLQSLNDTPQYNDFQLLDEYINNFLFDEPVLSIDDELKYIYSSLKIINYDMVVEKFNVLLSNLVML